MNHKLLTLLLAASCALSAIGDNNPTFRFGTATRPDGTTLTVDSRGMRLNGRPFIPVMGEIHYTRVPEQDWQRELRKMKAGGITVVATYVFWIHHEYDNDVWKWQGNHNLRRFVQLCHEEGLMVVLRLGPFCHGEVYQGGIPSWVHAKAKADPSYKIRSTSSAFLDDTKDLYQNIFRQVDGLLWKQGGPIVGVQLENECRGPWPYYAALKEMAVEVGFDVPFYTRTGWPALSGKEVFGQMLPLFGDYADGFWDRKLTDMPGSYRNAFVMQEKRMSENIATETFTAEQLRESEAAGAAGTLRYPYLTCELGGGMMTSYHRRINMSGRELKALAVCKLGSGSNLPGYYMYHGGVNPTRPEHTMGETQASQGTNHNDVPVVSYDFQAPLGEVGQPNLTSYNEARLLHYFLQSFGEELSQCDVDSLSPSYARRGAFEFRNDYVRILNEQGRAFITLRNYRLPSGTVLDSTTVEPIARVGDTFYFQEIAGVEPTITINGKVLTVKPRKRRYQLQGKPGKGQTETDRRQTNAGKGQTDAGKGQSACYARVLTAAEASTFYIFDGRVCTPHLGQLLYSTPKGLVEEAWLPLNDFKVNASLLQEAGPAREVPMGQQKVAAQPTDDDFRQAAVWQLTLPDASSTSSSTSSRALKSLKANGVSVPDDIFLEVVYRGDVARLYADGRLVQDNFWNGKPMHVRLSDIAGASRIELRILPLRHDAPIYLQSEQRHLLDADTASVTLHLDAINFIGRATLPYRAK